MISILLPIYNFYVVPLVEDLGQQAQASGKPFEIICLDDASAAAWRERNAPLQSMPGVQYEQLPQNLGRARIRNLLAERAQYPYLLFLDADSAVIRDNYLQTYLDSLPTDRILYGGRVYADDPPDDPTYYLHWHYGRQREAMAVTARQQHPYRTFMTNNYVIPRAIALRIRFDESILQYGYEDTLLADALQREGIAIQHLDNPVLHLGLETATNFLGKIRTSLDNLRALLPLHPQLNTRLLNVYRKLIKWRMMPWVRPLASPLLPILENLLQRKRLGLRWLDLYKLLYFIRPTPAAP